MLLTEYTTTIQGMRIFVYSVNWLYKQRVRISGISAVFSKLFLFTECVSN